MKKYLFVCLHIQCGEYEFYDLQVHAVDQNEDEKAFANAQAQKHYAGQPKIEDFSTEEEYPTYSFHDEQVAVWVNDYREIAETEFTFLSDIL